MQRARALQPDGSPAPDDAETRLREIAAALQDVVEGLALVDAAALAEDARRQLLRARAAGRAAARIVGTLPADTGPTDLSDVVADLEDRWGGHARARGAALSVTVAPDVPRQVALDRPVLERVLSLLLAQAMAGSVAGSLAGSRGGTVRLLADCAGGALAVRVSGPGRPGAAGPEDAVAVARALAAALGGRIDMAASADAGFDATLALPRAAWDLPGAGVPDRALEGVRVQLATPGAEPAAALAAIVQRHGGRVVAEEEAGGAAPIAVIVIDGPEAAEALRQLRAATHGPVLALSPRLLARDRDDLAAAGADAVLALPLPPAEVVVEALLAARRNSAPDAEGFDPDKLLRLLDLAGPEVAGELLDRLAEDLGTVGAVLSAAAPARDIAALRAQTHVLISLAGAVGAERLQHLAEDLNAAAHAADADAIDRLWGAAAPLLSRLRTHVDGVRAAQGTAP